MTMSGLSAVDMMEGGKIKLEEQMSASKTQSLARSRRPRWRREDLGGFFPSGTNWEMKRGGRGSFCFFWRSSSMWHTNTLSTESCLNSHRPLFNENLQPDKMWGRVQLAVPQSAQLDSSEIRQRKRLFGEGRVVKVDWTQKRRRLGPSAQMHFQDRSLRRKLLQVVQFVCSFLPSFEPNIIWSCAMATVSEINLR